MNLQGFFAQNALKPQKQSFMVSKRFTHEDKAILWDLGCISAMQNNEIKMQCFLSDGSFNTGKYQAMLISACTLYPNLNDINLQNSYSVHTAEELIGAMLTPGEFESLSNKVFEINGFSSEESLVEQAKN